MIPLGIGNAFTRKYFNTSLLVLCGGRTHLIDAPAPLRHMLQRASDTSGVQGIDIDSVDTLLLTHLHGDHCNGVEEFGFWRRFHSRAPKPDLYILPELAAPLWDNRLSASMLTETEPGGPANLETYFRVHPIEPGATHDLGTAGLEVEVRRTIHFIPCIGMRFRWQGRSIGYSCDTAFDPGMIEFLKDCDLIIHETSPGPGHTSINELMTLPAEVRNKMRLIHIPDDLDPATAPIPVLEQGRAITL